MKRKVIALQQAHGAQTILIEKTGLGLNLVQDLTTYSPAGFPNPIGIVPQGDKITRMEAECARIEAGHMVLPRDAPWLDLLLTANDESATASLVYNRWKRFRPVLAVSYTDSYGVRYDPERWYDYDYDYEPLLVSVDSELRAQVGVAVALWKNKSR